MSDPSVVPENQELTTEVTEAPSSERDTRSKQDDPITVSETAQDPEVDETQVDVLPGTGGPDDVGGVDVDPSELNLSGDSIPGHPKPGTPEYEAQ